MNLLTPRKRTKAHASITLEHYAQHCAAPTISPALQSASPKPSLNIKDRTAISTLPPYPKTLREVEMSYQSNRPYDEDNDGDVDMNANDFDFSLDPSAGYFAPGPSGPPNPLITLPPPQAPTPGTTGVGAFQNPQAYVAYVPAQVFAPLARDIKSSTDTYPYYDDSRRQSTEDAGAAQRRIDRASLAMGTKRKGIYQIMHRQPGESETAWRTRKSRAEAGRDRAEKEHAKKIDPSSAAYHAKYAQFWATDKAARKTFNVQRRAEALEHRRAFDAANGRPRVPTPDPAEDSGDERYAPRQWDGTLAPTQGPYRQYPPAGFPNLGYMPQPGQFPVGIRTNPPSDRCEPCTLTKKGACDLGKRGWYPCSQCVVRGTPDQCVNDKGRTLGAATERPADWEVPDQSGIPSNAGPAPTSTSRRRSERPSAPSLDNPFDEARVTRRRGAPARPGAAAQDNYDSDKDEESGDEYPLPPAPQRRSDAQPPQRPAGSRTGVYRGFAPPKSSDLVVRQLGYQPNPGEFPQGIRTNPHSDKCERCHHRKKGDCDLGTTGYPCSACVRDGVTDHCVNGVGYKYNIGNRTVRGGTAVLNQQNQTASFTQVSQALRQPNPNPQPQPAPRRGRPKVQPASQPRLPDQGRRSRSPRARVRSQRQTCTNCRVNNIECTGDAGACEPCRRMVLICDDPANLYRHEHYAEDETTNEEAYNETCHINGQNEPFGVSNLGHDSHVPGAMNMNDGDDLIMTGQVARTLPYTPVQNSRRRWQIYRSPTAFDAGRDWGTMSEEQQRGFQAQQSRMNAFRQRQQQDAQAASINSYMQEQGQGPSAYVPAAYEVGQAAQEFNTHGFRNPRMTDPEGVLSAPEEIDFNQVTGLLPPRSHTIQPPFVINLRTINLPDIALFSFDDSGQTRAPLLDPLEGKAAFNRVAPQVYGDSAFCGENEDYCSLVYPYILPDGPICGKGLAEPCYILADHGAFYTCSDCTATRKAFYGGPAEELQRRVKVHVCADCAPVISAKANCRQYQCDCIMTLLQQTICNRHMATIFKRYEEVVAHIQGWFAANFPQFAAVQQLPCGACANVVADRRTDVWGCMVCRCWVRGLSYGG